MRYFLILIIVIVIAAPVWAIFGSRLFEKKTNDASNDSISEFKIEFPEDELVTDSSSILLTGNASNDYFLAITGPQVSEIVKINEGKFSRDLKLENGFNQFEIIAFDNNGIKYEAFRQIYLIKEESTSFVPIAFAQESTDSSDLEKFKDKLIESRSKRNLRVVAGMVKSVLGETLTISKFENVKTIKINDQTVVSGFFDGNSFDFKKILVNDFVVSVGNLDASGVYESQTLLISKNKEIKFPNRFVFSNVTSIDGDLITVSDENLSKYQLNLENAENLTGEEIEATDKIGVVGEFANEELIATHFVVFKSEKNQSDAEKLQTATDSAN